jgi:hypothetical protein
MSMMQPLYCSIAKYEDEIVVELVEEDLVKLTGTVGGPLSPRASIEAGTVWRRFRDREAGG